MVRRWMSPREFAVRLLGGRARDWWVPGGGAIMPLFLWAYRRMPPFMGGD